MMKDKTKNNKKNHLQPNEVNNGNLGYININIEDIF